MKRVVAAALAPAIMMALLVGGAMMYAAWDHNPQGEFHEVDAAGTTTIHWVDWLMVGAGSFGATLGALCLAGLILVGVGWLLRRLVALL